MKNIHVLPTDKPSKLKQNKITKKLSLVNKGIDLTAYIPINIYITSSEEIKEEDWVYHCASNKLFKYDGRGLCVEVEKIILTTDQDLIKDGVQAIDDDFLEWFVKNPSCEEVEVGYGWIRLTETDNEGYWVSIPNKQFEMQQEEPKQELHSMDDEVECNSCGNIMSLIEDESIYACYNSECTSCYEEYEEEPKQETLEEAACIALGYEYDYWLKLHSKDQSSLVYIEVTTWCKGAKWQQERSYSEEEVYNILVQHTIELFKAQPCTLDEFFEQFKKK